MSHDSVMAKMYPSSFVGDVWAEGRVFEALERLPAPWIVVHDVAFPVRSGRSPTEDGQADFVLLHPQHGVVVLEVKGGQIEADSGGWTSANRDGVYDIKDPFKQVVRIKYGLLAEIRRASGLDPWCSHGVVFPSTASADGPIGLHDPDIVLFSEALDDPGQAIDRLLRHHNVNDQGLATTSLEKLAGRLAPTVKIAPRSSDVAAEFERHSFVLTQQQRAVLQATKSWPRLRVQGGAGTGKTVLAVERARQLAATGRSVLVLCFNQPLGKHLADELKDQPNVTAGNFHQLAAGLIASDRRGESRDQSWLDHGLAEAFFESCVDTELSWDAILIDEGQDFRDNWLELLEQLVREDGQMVIFNDANQDVFGSNSRLLGFPEHPLTLDINCRNTPQIHERASAVLQLNGECLNDFQGPEPRIEVVDNEAAMLKRMRQEVHRLVVDEGFDVADVAVLSSSRDLVDEIRSTGVGRWTVGPVFESSLVGETIHRFKGLEALAVVLLLPDHPSFDSKLAYVGISRARASITVFCGPRTTSALNWSVGIS